jgi:hypothetical protein
MKRCKCGKELRVLGSLQNGWYTLCDCNEVGYFDDSKGNEMGNKSQFDWVTSDSFIINKK